MPVLQYIAILIVPCLVMLLKYYWDRRNLYLFSWQCNGPFAWPFIGNALDFTGGTASMTATIEKYTLAYPFPFRFWVGPYFHLTLESPEDIRTILTSPKCLKKESRYDIIGSVSGVGLISSPVDIWKRHRKLISPAFGQRTLNSFVAIFNNQATIFNKKIKDLSGFGGFNIFYHMSLCTLDIICETAMGIKIEAQTTESKHLHIMQRLAHIIMIRMSHVLYHYDVTFKMTTLYTEFNNLHKEMRELLNSVILQKRKEMENNHKDILNDEISKVKPFLELLLEISREGEGFTDKEIFDEVVTFIFAGSDTTATTNSYTCMMLGMHQNIQEKVFEELNEIFGESDRCITCEDLTKLEYLERVIKETMRLFPVTLMIAREITEEITIGKYKIPIGVSALLSILAVHRDPKLWPDPLKFDPDRFLPEKIVKMHPYAYIPFSGGARNCIGAKFAIMSMKTVIANVLREYKLTTTKYKKIEDIKLNWKMIVCPVEGFSVEFEQRKYKNVI